MSSGTPEVPVPTRNSAPDLVAMAMIPKSDVVEVSKCGLQIWHGGGGGEYGIG